MNLGNLMQSLHCHMINGNISFIKYLVQFGPLFLPSLFKQIAFFHEIIFVMFLQFFFCDIYIIFLCICLSISIYFFPMYKALLVNTFIHTLSIQHPLSRFDDFYSETWVVGLLLGPNVLESVC